MAFVLAIVHAYGEAGRDPGAALRTAQIAPSQLRQKDARVTAHQFEALSAHAMRELDDEALGWFARRLPWGSYGMLARASLGAPDLGVALARWCRHHALLTDDIALGLQRGSAESAAAGPAPAVLTLQERRPLAPALREFCIVSVLRNALGLASWYIDSRIALQEARFAFPAPAHARLYGEVLFPAPRIAFDAPRTELRFAAAYLAQPIRRDEAALRQMLRRALPLIVLPHRRDRLLVQQVRRVLQAEPERAHGADSLAARLNLSARTLHRQLKEEGASLQQLKDAARRDRAIELLLRTSRPVKQIAAATGFASEKSFIRAFTAWVGIGPGAFRQRGGTKGT